MKTHEKLRDLQHFTAQKIGIVMPSSNRCLFTDGAKYVADQAGAYWLFDEIALAQRFEPKVKAEAFQVWKLVVKADARALLSCDDGDGRIVYSKIISFTDFPAPGIEFYYCNNTIHLPSEYQA